MNPFSFSGWRLFAFILMILTRSAGAQTIGVGEQKNGAIVVGSQDSYTFEASVGDQIIVRAGGTNFTPHVRLFGPGDVLLNASSSSSINNRDGEASARATNGGTFAVVVSSYYAGGSGTYALNLARAPGVPAVSSGDEGGTLTNGWRHTGVVNMGDLDQWSFSAAAGDSVVVRAGAGTFTPHLRIYGPDGSLLDANSSSSVNNRDAEAGFLATNNGTFTVVLSSYYLNGSGSYAMTLAKAPAAIAVSSGDQGGSLTNGLRHAGEIVMGDLDLWDFQAEAGDRLILRAGGVGFMPLLRLYDSAGNLVAFNSSSSINNRDAEVSFRATNSGPFSVVVSTYYLNGTGGYELSLARPPGSFLTGPGDEGGPATNGWRHAGAVALGDLDVWSFPAVAGESILLRVGGTNFTPLLRLFDPSGNAVGANSSSSINNRDGEVAIVATNDGVFTLVLSTYYQNGFGGYDLSFAKAPGEVSVIAGDEGGSLTNGWLHAGVVHTGDLDVWRFSASAGDSLVLRAGGSGFTPYIRLFNPDGVEVAATSSSSINNRDGEMSLRSTNSGIFTAVLSSHYLNGSGGYRFNLSKSPGTVVLADGDEGGGLTASGVYSGAIEQGDADVWSFTGCVGELVSFTVTGTNFTPWIRLYGPDGTLHAANVSMSINTRIVSVSYMPTNCGVFSVVLSSYYLNGSGGYQMTDNGQLYAMRLCRPLVAGPNMTLFGVGGPAGENAVLSRSAAIELPFSSWTRISTNMFDSLGVFEVLEPYDAAGSARYFYRFKLE